MASGAFFLQRLNDHVRYMHNIDAALAGRSDFAGCADNACKLGTWLYGTGREEASACGEDALQLFDQIFEPHKAFHEASHRALESHASGDTAAAAKAVTEMHMLSVKLVNILIALDKKATDCK